jgi:prephenate dehydrogenase
MVRIEGKGIENATPLLFEGTPCALISCPETSPETTSLAEELVLALEAEPVPIPSGEYQALNALVDHLPRLAAAALVLAAEGEQRNHPAFARLARAAFRDTTRPAAYPPQGLGFEMTEAGDNHLRQLTERFIAAMGEMLRLPAWALEARLERAAAAREDLLEKPQGETAAA